MFPVLSCAIAPCVPPKAVPVGSALQPDTTSYVHSPLPVRRTCDAVGLVSGILSACSGSAEANAAAPADARKVRRDSLYRGVFMVRSSMSPRWAEQVY